MDKLNKKRELTKIRVKKFRKRKSRKITTIQSNTLDGSSSDEYEENLVQRELFVHQSFLIPSNIHSDYSTVNSDDGLGNSQTFRENLTNDVSESEFISQGEFDSPVVSENEDDCENRYYSPDISDAEKESDSSIYQSTSETDLLRQWAVDHSIPHAHLDGLLEILRKRLLPELPKTAKTFLGTTSANYNIKVLADEGEFVYFGIAEGLKRCVRPDFHKNNELNLVFNVDGLPLFKSSRKEFTPILCCVFLDFHYYEPFIVALYAGNEKPKDLHFFLEDFINEMNSLQNGLCIEGKLFKINIKCFICDTIARSHLKCVKGHGGYGACERCTVHGVHVKQYNKVVFTEGNCSPRNNTLFRTYADKNHHTGSTPLLQIQPQIDMVNCFVLDFMHLAYLGIMKKLLLFWLTDLRYKLGRQDRDLLNLRLQFLEKRLPVEFARKPRSTKYIAQWKATEFRLFLLYLAPVILIDILPRIKYEHFLLFHSASRLLCDRKYALEKNEHAKSYLGKFVNTAVSKDLYDVDFLTMNTHNLIHVADDARNMQCSLSEITAFPFESCLGHLKKMLRSGQRPVAQLSRRIHEINFSSKNNVNQSVVSVLEEGQNTSTNESIIVIKKFQFKNTVLTNSAPNNKILLKNGECVEIIRMSRPCNKNGLEFIEFQGRRLHTWKAIFNYPFDSSLINMWQLGNFGSSHLEKFTVEQIEKKMVTLCIQDPGKELKTFIMPFLH